MTTLSTDKYITTSLLSLFQWISEWIKGASCLLCFSLSRQGLEERHKREKNGHDLNSKTPGLFFYPTLTDINISSRRQSASAQKLSKLTCRSIFRRNRSNILIDQQVTTGSCVKLRKYWSLSSTSTPSVPFRVNKNALLFLIYIAWLRYDYYTMINSL